MKAEELKYTEEHEWVGVEAGLYVIGITDFAQDQLGDITYIELPDEDREVAVNEEVAVVESVKAASDIYAPLAGTVAAANEALEDTPELVNQDPFGEGWIFKLKDVDETALDALMDYAAYQAFTKQAD